MWKIMLGALLLLMPLSAASLGGNKRNDSLSKAKQTLHTKVYARLERKTLYCQASFSGKKIIDGSIDFTAPKYKGRSSQVEWEHIVAAEHFGQFFSEWRTGHKECVNKNGKEFKGRQCASKMNMEYRYMFADMYNLFPAIGSVNAFRSNKKFADGVAGDNWGGCEVKFTNKLIEPRDGIKGIIARTHLYMDNVYSKYKLSSKDKKLFNTWSNKYPVTSEECKRAKLIERIQGNSNRFVKTPCIRADFW